MYSLSQFKLASVTKDAAIAARNQQTLKDMNIDWIWKETKGADIKIAIIDTGIDLTHPDLKMNIKATFNSVTPGSSVSDTIGHGTHVAGSIAANGIIKGVAPEAQLYIVKAFAQGSTSLNSIISGIDWAVSQGVDIISMSLGAQKDDQRLYAAIQRAHKAGIICVCAAGNDNIKNSKAPTIDYPARYSETLAVGAVDSLFNIAEFSSTGNVDVVAAGVDIASTFLNGSYAVMSGTSMATPSITGAIALYLSNSKRKMKRKLTFEEIRVLLAMNSLDLGVMGLDDQYGYGLFTF